MIVGDSGGWRRRLIDAYAVLLTRIAAVWPRCSTRFDNTTKENAMTDQLALALQRDFRTRGQFHIVPQYKLLDEDKRGDVVTKGFVDIAVLFHPDHRVYLAFECKRLSITDGGRRWSQAGAYADKGLMRFVSAQYAQALALGAMLGYVMDGDVDWASGQLHAALRSRATQLGFDGSLEDLPTVAFMKCFRTRHRRLSERVSSLEVRHALLPVHAKTPSGD